MMSAQEALDRDEFGTKFKTDDRWSLRTEGIGVFSSFLSAEPSLVASDIK